MGNSRNGFSDWSFDGKTVSGAQAQASGIDIAAIYAYNVYSFSAILYLAVGSIDFMLVTTIGLYIVLKFTNRIYIRK